MVIKHNLITALMLYSVFYFIINLLFAVTPLFFNLMMMSGFIYNESDAYPELYFLLFGIPTAILMNSSIFALKFFQLRNSKLKIFSKNIVIYLSFWISFLLSIFFIWVLFLPIPFAINIQFILDYYLIVIVPFCFVLLFIGCILAWQAKSR